SGSIACAGRASRRISAPIMIPFVEAHRWQANMRILEIAELKTVPYAGTPSRAGLSQRYV
ncbi:MAG TPA: hypothetical protein VMS04_25070, partial [Vicinamibacterales bacterium]|nr:hypothetical protein [Vicinamibacterales bacterium]